MKILITGFFDKESENQLPSTNYEVFHALKSPNKDDFSSQVREVDGLILGGHERIDDTIISSASKLRVIGFLGIGYERFIDVDSATRHGVAITYTPHANKQAVADLTIGLILALCRRIPISSQEVKQGIWLPSLSTELGHLIVGIVGMGAVGTEVARRAHSGFQMQIIYHSRSRNNLAEREFNAKPVSLTELLHTADIVSLHCPLTPQTNGMIGESELALMKGTSYLINTARPDLIDAKALRATLSANGIAGAAIDGYYTEPAPKPMIDRFGYGMLELSDGILILTPHIGALTVQSLTRMSEMAVEGVRSILERGSYQYVANPGYRSYLTGRKTNRTDAV